MKKIISILAILAFMATPCFAEKEIMFTIGDGSAITGKQTAINFQSEEEEEASSDGFVGNNGTSAGGLSITTFPDNNKVWFNYEVATTSGAVSYIHVYFTTNAGDCNVVLADASRSKIADGTLTTSNDGAGWYHFALDSGQTITSGTTYMLGVGSSNDNSYSVGYTSETDNLYVDSSATVADSMPASYDENVTEATDKRLLIYADNSAT